MQERPGRRHRLPPKKVLMLVLLLVSRAPALIHVFIGSGASTYRNLDRIKNLRFSGRRQRYRFARMRELHRLSNERSWNSACVRDSVVCGGEHMQQLYQETLTCRSDAVIRASLTARGWTDDHNFAR